jgi:hypothetical protein
MEKFKDMCDTHLLFVVLAILYSVVNVFLSSSHLAQLLYLEDIRVRDDIIYENHISDRVVYVLGLLYGV